MFLTWNLTALSLVLGLWSCNANPSLRGDPNTSEGQPPAVIDSRSVVPLSRETETSTEPSEAAEIEETSIALEPTPIGGAFLTCRYPDNQLQGAASYQMDCVLTPPAPITVMTVTASFRKIDTQGQSYNLDLVQENIADLSWVVSETPTSLFYRTVEASISVNGSPAMVFKTEIAATMSLQRVASYWLGGEPNNVGGDEDCVAYENLAGKNIHANATGLTTGPLGRSNDSNCALTRNFLCKIIADKTRPKWAVSTVTGPFSAAATACPEGYRFALPMSDVESQEVNALIDQRSEVVKMWVPLTDRDKEGEFRIGF
ncbi:MAG TPA: hypothetical protein VE954_38850 [Oligoflexus sp.]|uniref:hypothetical protein n=1 Tax=Oligoflexus sp. TaxID=1971216 RepID=UPI002D250170|nr:hypothetical protein [Oligoflexus sp.]HYX39101.1 hypothetical protein [Oligoflexus sp.]